jgi:hypothetical protein
MATLSYRIALAIWFADVEALLTAQLLYARLNAVWPLITTLMSVILALASTSLASAGSVMKFSRSWMRSCQ